MLPLSCPLDSWADMLTWHPFTRNAYGNLQSLRAVSSQTESEALNVFYGENMFLVDLFTKRWLTTSDSPADDAKNGRYSTKVYAADLTKHIPVEHIPQIRHVMVLSEFPGTYFDPRAGPMSRIGPTYKTRKKTDWEIAAPNLRTLRIRSLALYLLEPEKHTAECQQRIEALRVTFLDVLRSSLGIIGRVCQSFNQYPGRGDARGRRIF